ncbi:PQQ-dependent sugar dehydrogenase [Mucilaginibacter agri]|uniref:PQQ-dependent sugar dehydrogenase n=1 Tax=Mucilaginibacter agri TaxID=2695265 RepID=A0A965ZJV5_9SPHI|nr:PQQ-dependent sugar dehydrogenase [Mucilaginibacter agri]NCD72495.1 PQQ-dependent sugar dehydrogenase [Mucilaginibacter agri]
MINFYRYKYLICTALMACVLPVNAKAQSVEKNEPTADYKPAFPGQTRIQAVKTKTQLQAVIINEKLENPWGLCIMPDGGFLISEKKGNIVILDKAGRERKTITDLPKVNAAGQGGFLDVTLSPNFAKDRLVYYAYSEPQSNGSTLAIGKGKLSADELQLQNQTVIYRITPAYTNTLQYGSRIVFDKSGNLFVSTGERSGSDTRVLAQALNSSLGKILHITPGGTPVPNGPFAKVKGARPEIYTYGHRNPDGLAIDPNTGELWEAEFGPKGGDEINLIKPGNNYGWPVITYGIEYSGEKVGEGIQQKQGMTQPVYYWNPVISPGSIAFYNSNVIPEWKGNLFVAALSGSHIDRLVIRNNKVVGEERFLEGKQERFRDLAQGNDGALYAITDGGKLYRISKK